MRLMLLCVTLQQKTRETTLFLLEQIMLMYSVLTRIPLTQCDHVKNKHNELLNITHTTLI